MSEANPTLDPIGYRCDGCGRLFKDPYADLSAIRATGGRSCCPERKPVGLSDRIEELENRLEKEMSDLDAADRRITRLQARIQELEERLKAATDDAKEAEAYAGELEAKLTGGKDE